jgi:hypothetical protein
MKNILYLLSQNVPLSPISTFSLHRLPTLFYFFLFLKFVKTFLNSKRELKRAIIVLKSTYFPAFSSTKELTSFESSSAQVILHIFFEMQENYFGFSHLIKKKFHFVMKAL